jgi:glutathione peroxidase
MKLTLSWVFQFLIVFAVGNLVAAPLPTENNVLDDKTSSALQTKHSQEENQSIVLADAEKSQDPTNEPTAEADKPKKEQEKVIYDFDVKNSAEETVTIEQYKGKVLLIVNTASKCGYTRQYEGLEKLYRQYKDKGVEILAFPCNQFGSQEPGTNKEIQEFCQSTYDVTFPVFAKIDVNGDETHPLYKCLKSQAKTASGTEDIKWNFTKFLISKDGKTIQRFPSAKEPADLTDEIDKLLLH